MFRRLLEQLEKDATGALDKTIDPQSYASCLSRYGGTLINELHGHHQIEDAQYFPTLAKLDAGAARGFELLDADHHSLDEILSDLAGGANAVLRNTTTQSDFMDATAAFQTRLTAFRTLLNRHLVDEEELVVPVLLKYAPPAFR